MRDCKHCFISAPNLDTRLLFLCQGNVIKHFKKAIVPAKEEVFESIQDEGFHQTCPDWSITRL